MNKSRTAGLASVIAIVLLIAVFGSFVVAQAPTPMTPDEMATNALQMIMDHPEAMEAFLQGAPVVTQIGSTVDQVGRTVTVTVDILGYMNGEPITQSFPITFEVELPVSAMAITDTVVPTETCGHANIGVPISSTDGLWWSSDPNVISTPAGRMINVTRTTGSVAANTEITFTGVISQNTWVCNSLLQLENFDSAPWRVEVDANGVMTKTAAPATVE